MKVMIRVLMRRHFMVETIGPASLLRVKSVSFVSV